MHESLLYSAMYILVSDSCMHVRPPLGYATPSIPLDNSLFNLCRESGRTQSPEALSSRTGSRLSKLVVSFSIYRVTGIWRAF